MQGYIAGIGSRETPDPILSLMEEIGYFAGMRGWMLSSGCAPGADSAFERGFRRALAGMRLWNPRAGRVMMHDWAKEEIAKYCLEKPFHLMTDFVQQLLVRNMYQILGEDGKSPVKKVICWTHGITGIAPSDGGTRYAVRCAVAHGIPVDNLRDPITETKYREFIASLKKEQTVQPKVVNKRTNKGKAVYVGRPTKWGNPFSHENGTLAEYKVSTRDEAVESYEKWILQQPELLASLHELRGHNLECWCAPLRCHADVLVKLSSS